MHTPRDIQTRAMMTLASKCRWFFNSSSDDRADCRVADSISSNIAPRYYSSPSTNCAVFPFLSTFPVPFRYLCRFPVFPLSMPFFLFLCTFSVSFLYIFCKQRCRLDLEQYRAMIFTSQIPYASCSAGGQACMCWRQMSRGSFVNTGLVLHVLVV